MGVNPVWMYIVDVVLVVELVSLITTANRRRRGQSAGQIGRVALGAYVVLGVMAAGFTVWTWVQVFTSNNAWRAMLVAGVFVVALTYVYWLVLGKHVWRLAR